MLTKSLVLVLVLALVLAGPGCNTLRGAVGGGAVMLSAAAESSRCGMGPEEALFALTLGAVIGAIAGLIEDIRLALASDEQVAGRGAAWDSPEGLRLRMMTGSAGRTEVTDIPAASDGSSHR